MYWLKQEFITKNGLETLVVEADDFMVFKNKYFSEASKIASEDISYRKEDQLSARIYLGISFDSRVDFAMKSRVVKALAPVFEIGLDKAIDSEDDKYLLNYRKKGFEFEIDGKIIKYSLGDSNLSKEAFAMVALAYWVLYNPQILEKYNEKFRLIKDEIVEGGFNSASFNGLQGYYFSSYFIVWLLELKKYASRAESYDFKLLEPMYDLFDKLQNPRDSLIYM